MWTIPLFKVRAALSLRAAQIQARKSLYLALDLAGDDANLRTAIRLAVVEAETACLMRPAFDEHALSGAEHRA